MNNSEARVVSADDGESSEDSRCRRQRRKEEHKKRKKQKKEKNNKKKKRSCDDECDQCKKKVKPEDKDDMGDGADGKLPPQETQNKFPRAPGVPAVSKQTAEREPPSDCYTDDKIVQSSALDFCSPEEVDHSDTTLLLFYGYVEPPWDEETYKNVLQDIPLLGKELGGRMRVAREGLNCTLTGTHKAITNFCKTLRHFHKGEFLQTEFKLTRDLPLNQRFPNLKVIPVQELVHYGLECEKAPSIDFTGIHLEPEDYHKKLAEDNTVVIDVRNHYEAIIGHFDAPGAEMLDPMMRKSTEFPVWLDKPEVKAKLKNKQVLMYCTGGVRCERASALLKYKMEKDPEIKELNIQGVYQLQGGIDKYFKAFPEGGFWSGKNYVFDKRFAHAPPKIDGEVHTGKRLDEIKSKCEACGKPWDMFRGKRRCPTCGVPSLICRDCFQKDKSGERKLDRSVRCDLCVSQDIRSKAQLRERQRKEMKEYEQNQVRKGMLKLNKLFHGSHSLEQAPSAPSPAPNPDGVTRLLLKNMCRNRMDEATLKKTIPGITHIVWKTDRKTGKFFGQGWVEMATPQDAARAVARTGTVVLDRPLYISFQPPNPKDSWPPPSSAV